MTWAGTHTLISGNHRIDLTVIASIKETIRVEIALDHWPFAVCGGRTRDEAFRKARVAAEMTLIGMARLTGMEA